MKLFSITDVPGNLTTGRYPTLQKAIFAAQENCWRAGATELLIKTATIYDATITGKTGNGTALHFVVNPPDMQDGRLKIIKEAASEAPKPKILKLAGRPTVTGWLRVHSKSVEDRARMAAIEGLLMATHKNDDAYKNASRRTFTYAWAVVSQTDEVLNAYPIGKELQEKSRAMLATAGRGASVDLNLLAQQHVDAIMEKSEPVKAAYAIYIVMYYENKLTLQCARYI